MNLNEAIARDCERAGVDNLDPKDLLYERSYISGFMPELIRARTSAERQRIIGEASAFCAEQERRARLPPAPPMRTVDAGQRPMLTTQPVRRPMLTGR